MKDTLLTLSLAGAVCFAFSPTAADTINVPGDHSTIQAAIDAAADGDEVVVAAGTYTEALIINEKSITLRGSDPNDRPVVALQDHASLPGQGFSTTGLVISGDDIEVNVSDLILIPASSSAAARGIQVASNSELETTTVNFDNILITGNDGSDQPSVTDPFDDTTPLGTGFSSDGMYLVNRAFAGLENGVGIYTLNDVVVIGAGRDGIIIYVTGTASPQAVNASEAVATLTGVRIARTVRNFIQWGNGNDGTGTYNITGTRENPGLIAVNNATGGAPSGAGVSGVNGIGALNIDHMVYVDNPSPFHVVISESNPADVEISNSLFANIDDDALTITGTGEGTLVVRESTFFNNGDPGENTAGLWSANTELSSGLIQDNVFAGAGTGAIILNENAGTPLTIANNAFVLSGPHGLAQTVFGTGAAEVTPTGTVTANPNFISIDVSDLDALQEAFDVNSFAYQSASSASEPLTGWGDFIEPDEPTDARSWALYH